MKSHNLIDMTGRKISRLTVLGRGMDRGGKVAWNCRCDCGNLVTVIGAHLRSGNTGSCGCYKIEATVIRRTRHGHAGGRVGRASREYAAWSNMHSRCLNPLNKRFGHYGGRGITVCDRWQMFENFIADMGRAPAGMTLDRIDNDEGYAPGNCRWATNQAQSQNRKSTRLDAGRVLEIRGRYEHGEGKRSIAGRLGVNWCTVNDVVNMRTWRNV